MLTLWRPHEDLFSWLSGASVPETFAPAVDVEEEAERYVIRADLPGTDEKDIDVRVEDGVLVLSARRETATEAQRRKLHYAERCRGAFSRQFALGTNVDQTRIEASYKHGVLTVALPKKPAAVARQIPVH
jgi:HSP20 family protein